MVSTANTSMNTGGLTQEEVLHQQLSTESRFSAMPKTEQDLLIQSKIESARSVDANKDVLFQLQLKDAKEQYANTDKAGKKTILNTHIQNLVDRGEPLTSTKPLNIIEQSVQGTVFEPGKRRKELQPKSESELVDALKTQLDDKNKNIIIDQSLTEYYSMNEGEIKIRFKNIRSRWRARKLTQKLMSKTPEEMVAYLIGKGKLYVKNSSLKDPNWVNEQLNTQYKKYIKGDIDALNAGNSDDKKLAQQIQNKLVAVKNSYGMQGIESHLRLATEGFN